MRRVLGHRATHKRFVSDFCEIATLETDQFKKWQDAIPTSASWSTFVESCQKNLLVADIDTMQVAQAKALEIYDKNQELVATYAYNVADIAWGTLRDAIYASRITLASRVLMDAYIDEKMTKKDLFNFTKEEVAKHTSTGIKSTDFHPTLVLRMKHAIKLRAAPP